MKVKEKKKNEKTFVWFFFGYEFTRRGTVIDIPLGTSEEDQDPDRRNQKSV